MKKYFILILSSFLTFKAAVSLAQSSWHQTSIGNGIFAQGLFTIDTISYVSIIYPQLQLMQTSDEGNSWMNAEIGSSIKNLLLFAKDSSGVYYASGANDNDYKDNGIYRSLNNGATWTKVYALNLQEYSSFRIEDIEVGADGTVYASVYKKRDSSVVIRSFDKGNLWEEIRHSAGETSNQGISDISISHSGVVYCTISGGYEDGLWYKDSADQWMYKTDGLFGNVTALATLDERVYVASSGSIFTASDNKSEFMRLNCILPELIVTDIYVSPSKMIYITTKQGVFYVKNNTDLIPINSGLHHFSVNAITENSKGGLLCATSEGGVYKLDRPLVVVDKKNVEFRISQNPVTTASQIILSTQSIVKTLSIIDLLGNTVKQLSPDGGGELDSEVSVDVSNLPNSVYTVLLRTNDELMTTKLVVSR